MMLPPPRIDAPAMITVLTKGLQHVRVLEPDEEHRLCHPAEDPEGLADLLLALYRQQMWLQCECGWAFHIRGGYTLARNPRQLEPTARPCALCLAWPYQRSIPVVREPERVPDGSGITLIPTGRRRTRSGPGAKPDRSGTSRSSIKYSSMFRVIWSVMDGAGSLSLPGPIDEDVVWQRVREVLALSPLVADEPEALSYADLAWTPTSGESPGDVLERVEAGWRLRRVRPQVWIFGIVETIPDAVEDRLVLEIPGNPMVVRAVLPARNRAVIGRRGPHLVMVQATRAADGGVQYDKLAAQAILSHDCPVPVDSSHERDAIRIVQEMEIPFYKPVFAVVEDLKPDVMLLDQQVLIEVQGMMREDYIEKKRHVHERIRTHPVFRGWRLITYEPNKGEVPDVLGTRLRGWWRS